MKNELTNMKVVVAGGDTELFGKIRGSLNGFAGDLSHAESARECLNIVRGDDVDVVLLVEDLIVNDNPGVAIGRIRNTAPRTSVVYMTRNKDERYALNIIRLGAADVVPIDDLSDNAVGKVIGRVAERSVASVQMVSQISDFVLTHSFDGIVALDLQNRILLWNNAMERMFGRKRQEVLGKLAIEELPFEGLEKEISLAGTGRSFAGERQSYLTRGERRYYQPYYSPLKNRSGTVIGVMANFRDLTDAYERDKMVTDLTERVNHLANTAPQMVWMAATDGARNFFSRKLIEFTGMAPEALEHDGWLVGIHPQDRLRFQTAYDRALQDRASFHVEYRMRRHDRRYRRLLDSGTPVIGSDGAFLGFIGSCTDTSESGMTQTRIDASAVSKLAASGAHPVYNEVVHTTPTFPKESGAYPTVRDDRTVGFRVKDSGGYQAVSRDGSKTGFRVKESGAFPSISGGHAAFRDATALEQSSTMDNAPIGVWKLDRDLVITKASKAVAEQLGMQVDDLIGKPFHDIVSTLPKEMLASVLELNENVQISGQKVQLGKGAEQRQLYWDIAAWPLKDAKQKVIGVCVSTIEVEEYSLVDKQREDFIATLVHDLKTPLIGADRTLELIINGTLGEVDESQSEVLQMVQRSNQGLLRMVQNLIEVYRYDFSNPDLAFEYVSLFDLGSDCAKELMAVADQRNIKLEINLAPGQGGVQVDALAIRRVVLNLLDNALKFTPSGGGVRAWGEETPNQVMLHIKDTGIGIDESEINKVFERFWRSERGKGQAVGTGLGLYLCKQIVDAHQGEIVVESREGEGTTFTVVMPRR
ncbi:MAG: PAS domain-containing protein [Candidatus Melainabacteria bacterium]|nr:PAS domain-containing protein [Candidatus Melainabacteria bacterium]